MRLFFASKTRANYNTDYSNLPAMDDKPKNPIEKLYKTPASIILVVGIIVTALLFKGLLMFADQGDLFMVILMAVGVSIVAFVLTKIIRLEMEKNIK